LFKLSNQFDMKTKIVLRKNKRQKCRKFVTIQWYQYKHIKFLWDLPFKLFIPANWPSLVMHSTVQTDFFQQFFSRPVYCCF
jgi:hypothetical protein